MAKRVEVKRRAPRILVVNDDGIYGVGLRPLAAALARVGEVTVVVPEQERSAASHAITLHKPIRTRRVDGNIHIINGTPADCVRFGVLSKLKGRVDMIFSGINRGANMGADTLYSGTVGGAREGCMLGVPSVAVSLAVEGGGHYEAAGEFAARLGKVLLARGLPRNVCLNVNVPDRPFAKIKGVSVAPLGRRVYNKDMTSRIDPRGETYFWLAGETPGGKPLPGTDMAAVAQGRISITPIRLDMTDADALVELTRWDWTLTGK